MKKETHLSIVLLSLDIAQMKIVLRIAQCRGTAARRCTARHYAKEMGSVANTDTSTNDDCGHWAVFGPGLDVRARVTPH